MKILSVVGTRPNFMKLAPIAWALAPHKAKVRHILVHTGQHYDARMSDTFFSELSIPEPDYNLHVGSGSHAQQTAAIMVAVEEVLQKERPDLVLVFGDVNSTLAAALSAKKLNLQVAHVEAGLRSGDRSMPEEINRLCTDAIADILFTTDRIASANLERENVPASKIHFVGNVMIDSLERFREPARHLKVHGRLGLQERGYCTMTLHRPANVDDPIKLNAIMRSIVSSLPGMSIVFPAHPRTRARLDEFGLKDLISDSPARPGLFLLEPMGYLEFLSLNSHARMILTDSGGLQEESTALGVPCITLRENTERPITVSEGSNYLAGTGAENIRRAIAEVLASDGHSGKRPEYWDGHAAERIVDLILSQ